MRLGLGQVQDRVMVGGYVPIELAERFKAAARLQDGGVSQALLRLIREAVGEDGVVARRGAGQGSEVKIRLRSDERMALSRAARERGTSPATWVRSLVLVHLMRRPVWNVEERENLRAIGTELRRIGVNVNQIAAALNAAALRGECPPGQGEAVERAIELLRIEKRRLAGVVTGNFDYYGLPSDERPTAQRGAVTRRNMKEEREAKLLKAKPKLRPRKFREGEGIGRE